MKVTVMPVVIGALGTVTKGLVQGQEDSEVTGRVDPIQTTGLLGGGGGSKYSNILVL